ncbi:MAG: diguanylate cyclase [Chitinivibrionales bacterium]|nr:diguanylate cyclase [Chitinivibrionales bacterium]MBD3358181.1 diguanylate cyclase [Chitinivibrionales bacterium]
MGNTKSTSAKRTLPTSMKALRTLFIHGGNPVPDSQWLEEARPSGVEVFVACDVTGAVDEWGDEEFHVTLMDFSATEERIVHTLDRLHEHWPKTAVVVLVDEKRGESAGLRALHAGAQDYLVKGTYDAATLCRTLRTAVERRRVMLDLERRNEEFQASEARLLSVITHNVDGILVVDSQGCVRFMNPAAELLFGVTAGGMLGKVFDYPLDPRCSREIDIRREDGKRVVVDMRVVRTEWEKTQAYLVSMRDITVRKLAEESLRESEERYALAVSGSKDGLWDWNLMTGRVYYAARWKAMLGYGDHEIGENESEWLERIHPSDLAVVKAALNDHTEGKTSHFESEHRIRHKNGAYRWFLVRGTAIRDENGKAIRIAGSQSDITERKEAEKSLKKALGELEFALASEKVLLDELDKKNKELVALSITDGLTGLYNHRFLQERFEFEFKRAKRYGVALSCMLMDIDHFKQINDTYGHQFGDLVLKEIAELLKRNSREVDICGRYGGEEFMIITNQGVEGALQYAGKLHAAIENHVFKSDDTSIHVTVSIGVTGYENDIRRRQEMIERADVALYQAKEDGRNLIRVWKEPEQTEGNAVDQREVSDLKAKFDSLSTRMRAMYIESTYALLHAVDTKDHYTEIHSQNVSRYAVAIAGRLGLHEDEVEVVKYAGLLHDVGRIGIDEQILVKRDALTEEEFEVLKKHPVIGADILRDVKFLEKEIPLVLYHHERYDGKGYPQGLRARQIPLGARILAVADAYDAMTTDRGFKSKMTSDKAVEELKRGKETQFAPEVVDAFVACLQEGEGLLRAGC